MQADRQWLDRNKTLVETQIVSLLADVDQDSANKLWETVKYALIPTGKCLRPLLALAVAEDLGADTEVLVLPAAALELVHVSSLIHDDMPALDNDQMRRGRPACHVAFDQAQALLAGDLLIALAHCAISRSQYAAELQANFHKELARAFLLLCLGQSRDLEKKQTKKEVLLAHAMKTGALFQASISFGLISANASSLLGWGAEFGLELGCFFQLADDYFDQSSEIENSGRQAGSDLRNDRSTLLSLNADSIEELQRGREKIKFLLERFKDSCGRSETRLEILVELVTRRNYLPN